MRTQAGVDIEKTDKSQSIRNRESWLKVLVIVLFSIIIAWKLVTTPININILDFRFIDILFLLLAIFAVGLSVEFYFKATETSNNFYANTYQFTIDISEILGRIEAGFGERLRHLDEGYIGLRDKFDRIPVDADKVKKQVEHEEEEVKKKENERIQLFETLAKRAKLEEKEKMELFDKLNEKNEEAQAAKNELEFLKRKLEYTESGTTHLRMLASTGAFLYQLADRLEVLNAPPDLIISRFNDVKRDIPERILNDMKRIGFIDSDNNLTIKGIKNLIDRATRQK